MAIQLELLLLAWAQGPARRPEELPPADDAQAEHDLVELIALPAVASVDGAQATQPADKRLRSLQSALDHLADESLVLMKKTGRDRFLGPIDLLHEEDDQGGRVRARRYALPGALDPTVDLPVSFFTQGWHYCLDPSEILVYLMIRDICSRGGHHITAEDRLTTYVLNKDALLRTKLLEAAGLLEVTRDPRQRPDGTVEGFGDRSGKPRLQRWALLDEGLERPARVALEQALENLESA